MSDGPGENEVGGAKNEKDVEYKTKELGSLNLAMTELSFDRDGVQSKHNVIHTYLGELKKLCIARSETFVERKAHREAERVPQLDEGDCTSWEGDEREVHQNCFAGADFQAEGRVIASSTESTRWLS